MKIPEITSIFSSLGVRIETRSARRLSKELKKIKISNKEPEEYLGPYENLSSDVSQIIQSMVETEDRLNSKEIYFHIKLSQLMVKLWWLSSRYKLTRPFSNLLYFISIIVKSLPKIFPIIYRNFIIVRDKILFKSSLPATLYAAGIKPQDFVVCYVKSISQPEKYPGFLDNRSENITYGTILGIDLIPSNEGYWFIESNLNFGISKKRSLLYDRDPFIINLLEYAFTKDYKNLIFLYNTSSYVNSLMKLQLQKESKFYGIEITFIEDPHLPGVDYISQNKILQDLDKNTLIVKTRFCRTSLDYLLNNKSASLRALKKFQSVSHTPMLIPEMSNEPIINHFNPSFPNVIYKLSDRDEGKGLLLMKVETSDQAKESVKIFLKRQSRHLLSRLYSFIDNNTGFYQPYIIPLMQKERCLYKIRAHVLITPIGSRFLSAHKVISKYPVPERLRPGIVSDSKPFIVNLATSAKYEKVSEEEKKDIEKSTISIADGLSWAINYAFKVNI